MTLHYVAAFDATAPERTWSGTTHALLQALRRRTDVAVHDVRLPRPVDALLRHTGLNLHALGEHKRRWQRAFLPRMQGRLLQFEELVPDRPGLQTAIYLDLTADALLRLHRDDHDTFLLSGFHRHTPRNLQLRATLQNEYLRHHATRIFTMGSWLRDDLISTLGLPPERVVHAGGGINIPSDTLPDPASRTHRRLLFIGRDWLRKGLGITVEAFEHLRRTMPDAELHIAGPTDNPFPNIAGVTFYGDITPHEAARLFAMADAFVMPSYFEAYGLVFIEALTAGLPVVARRRYEMAAFVEDGCTGLLLDDDDPRQLAALMQRALTDDTLRHNVAQRRPQYLQQYSWDAVAERILTSLTST